MDFVIGLLRGLIGIAFLLGVCYLLSSNRKAIDWPLVLKGIGIQLILAIAILYIPFIRKIFDIAASFFIVVLDFTEAGSTFLFGNLITDTSTFGYIFVFQVLPTIVFFAALSAVLYYLGILQLIIYVFAAVMKAVMGLSGSESLAAAANVFIGQTEAPLVVKPYLERMTKSELLCLMTGGMATIAGGVFAAYIGFLSNSFVDTTGLTPEAAEATMEAAKNLFAQHLLMASIISAPAAIVASKMLYPQVEEDKVVKEFSIPKDKIGSNVLEAISIGTTDGLKLAINVGAMLLVFTALVAMINFILGEIGSFTNFNSVVSNFAAYLQDQGFKIQESAMVGLNLEFLLGLLFAPVSWLLGVPTQDIFLVGQLLGQKTAINEFFAYTELAKVTRQLDIKSLIIATYALCGFSNFASIGIQIGGIGAIAPGQRKNLAAFGIRALIGGTVACFLTAAIAGMLVNAEAFVFS